MKKPKYAIVQTLLGGDPDINRRTVIDTDDGSEILVMNQHMSPWTLRQTLLLSLILETLNKSHEGK